MLANTLSNNEVKDSAGSEVEFTRLQIRDRSTVFAKVGESPAAPYRMTISHSEVGSGMKRRRRSVIRFDKTSTSGVDSVTPITTSCYAVLDFPIGASTATAEATNVIANLISFLATTGAGTTVLFNGTGSGAIALLNGDL